MQIIKTFFFSMKYKLQKVLCLHWQQANQINDVIKWMTNITLLWATVVTMAIS